MVRINPKVFSISGNLSLIYVNPSVRQADTAGCIWLPANKQSMYFVSSVKAADSQ